jgi:hypothetical protein
MREKILNLILKGIGKFLGKIVIVRRGYEENMQGKGFHTMRWNSDLTKILILGNDSDKNQKMIDQTSLKLVKECEIQVARDRKREMEKRKGKKKKK